MDYIYSLMPSMMEGLMSTVQIFILTLMLSIPLGILVALCKSSKFKVVINISEFYIWVMRGTPLLLQLVFIFFGLPVVGITFDRLTAVLIAFVLNYGAYFGEIFRCGIKAVDKGQYEAAAALGLNPAKTFRFIVFPQMMMVALPSIANEVITLVKDTSLIYVVGLSELLRVGKVASNRDASLVPLVVVGILYLLLTAILTKVFAELERKYSYS